MNLNVELRGNRAHAQRLLLPVDTTPAEIQVTILTIWENFDICKSRNAGHKLEFV